MSTLILYGSETGTAEDYAFILNSTLSLHGQTEVMPMNNVSPSSLLSIQHLVIICSTTGQGVFPQNAAKFYKFLLRRHPADLFKNLTIHVCGMGDSSYSQYNVCGRKLWLRFVQLGAIPGQRGEMDDCAPNGGEKWWEAWALKVVSDITGVEMGDKFLIGGDYNIDTPIKPLFNVEYSKDIEIPQEDGFKHYKLINRELLTGPEYTEEVYKYQFKSNEPYNVGDTLLIHPTNPEISVNSFMLSQHLTERENSIVKVSSAKYLTPRRGWFNNGVMTLREFLTHHINIHSPPPRRFFSIVWRFASDEREREKLYELAQLEETEQLFNYVNRPRRTLFECIQEFFSLRIPIEFLIDACGLIRPREYSISSSPNSELLELTVSNVNYTTILRTPRIGLCSSYLNKLELGAEIPANVVKKNINFPNGDFLIVSTGAGIAGAKPLIEISKGERNILMFTGHRFIEKDFLYSEEWQDIPYLQVIGCFSRSLGDKEHVKIKNIQYEKGYVQANLWKLKDQVKEFLLNGANVYVCGSSGKMPTEVRITIGEIMGDESYIKDMEKSGKYIEDVW